MPENLLLGTVPAPERRRLEPLVERVLTKRGMSLTHAEQPVTHLWFPLSGVYSSIVYAGGAEQTDGVEVGLIGREGVVGLPAILGAADDNAFHVIVQVPGAALRIPADAVSRLLRERDSEFVHALRCYVNVYLATAAQTAVCNRLHRTEQRMARWLLDVYMRTENPTLPLTHEFLALMVGAYRPTVSNALASFEERGLLSLGRGRIVLLDPPALRDYACVCHSIVARRLEDLLGRRHDRAGAATA